MILDIERKTVTLPAGGTLTLAQLWGIIDVMDPDIDSEVYSLLNSGVDPEAGRLHILPTHMYSVESDKRAYVYCVVRMADGTWACSCPNWIHRKSEDFDVCKHISRISWRV